MDTIQYNPARLHNCDETGITIVQNKHTKILGLKGKRQISSLQSAERGSLVTLHSSVTCFSKKWYEKRNNEWQTTWINPRAASLGVDTERDFFPVVSSFHQPYKADKSRSCHLSTGRKLFINQEPGGHYFSSRESCWHHLPPSWCCIYSFWAPDDGRSNRLKHIEHFTEINKLCNVASCWLYLEICHSVYL
jgi:hypothetical protein